MADESIENRRFTDDEVREILKMAVESSPSRARGRGDGVSLQELRDIASEVGIDPARVEDAARSVTLTVANRPNRLAGGPLVLNVERRIEGEVDPESTADVLALIRRTMGTQGDAQQIHGSLEWSSKSERGERLVTLSPRDGSTTIRASSNLSQTAVVTFLPPGAIGLIVSMIGFTQAAEAGSELGIVAFAALLPLLYLALRTLMGRMSRLEAGKLQRVVDDLARMNEVDE